MQKMKHIFYKNYYKSYTNFLSKKVWIILLCLAFLLYSCDLPSSSSSSLTFPPSATKAQAQRALENIQTKYAGNMSALYQAEAGGISSGDNILLIAHGGPEFALLPIKRFLHYDDASYTLVVVKQGQMLRPDIDSRTVVPTEAQAINLESIAILYTLAKNFQDNGHKVSLYANSWGAFLAAEILHQYGDAPFEKLIISSGRLDMPKEISDARARGVQKQFKRDGKTIFTKTDIPDTELKAVFSIQADLNRNQYTKLLSGKISKVIYYFGGQDQALGRLTKEEVRFLTNKNNFNFSSIAKYKTGIETHQFLSECVIQVTGLSRCTPVTTARPDPRYPLTRNIYTVIGDPGFATVKFAMEDAHSTPTLTNVKKADMIASFQ